MSRSRSRALAFLLAVGLSSGCATVPPTQPASPSPPASSVPTTSTPSPASTPSAVDPSDGPATCWSAPAAGTGTLGFTDRTGPLGLITPLAGMMVHAVAAGDVNDDGWTDLFVGGFADRPDAEYAVRGASGPAPDRLLLGSAHGFVLDDSFPAVRGRTSGAAFADLDADGDLDLVISRNPRPGERSAAPTVVLRNDGGRFAQATVLDTARGFRSVGVLDYDGDGRLDLFIAEDRWTGGSSVLYRNTGGLRFEDATATAGLPSGLNGLGVSTADLDGDHRPDLFVAGSNRLFLNTGGRFSEAGGQEFTWTLYGNEDDPAGVSAWDLDGDGRIDLVIGQHFNSTIDGGRAVPVRVYANRGPGDGRAVRFEDVTDTAGLVGLRTKSPHVEVTDVDADGRPDLVTTAVAGPTSPVVFRNVSTPASFRFEPVAAPGGPAYWVTGTTLDADHDGAAEIFLGEWYPTKPSLLLSVTGTRGHWLVVEVGKAGSAGVGAEVSVYRAGALGQESALLGRTQIAASAGYAGGAEPVARFGLGAATTVDLTIGLPGAAKPLEWRGVGVDRWLRVGAACPA